VSLFSKWCGQEKAVTLFSPLVRVIASTETPMRRRRRSLQARQSVGRADQPQRHQYERPLAGQCGFHGRHLGGETPPFSGGNSRAAIAMCGM
jgi:hypothetical protein